MLFASEQFPELNRLILRRFSEPRDVETAFRLELQTKVKRRLIITETEKAPTRAFTFMTLSRHYAKQALTHGKYRHEIGSRDPGSLMTLYWEPYFMPTYLTPD